MFDFDIERSLITEENIYKPNQYVSKAMIIGFFAQTICFVLNELDIFYIDKNIMRFCYIIAVICSAIPQIIAHKRSYAVNPVSIYIMLGCVLISTFTLNLTLFIFATPTYVLPMILAVQYNSSKISKLAIAGSCFCIAVTPPLGCLFGLWDVSFFRFLASNTLGVEVAYSYLTPISRQTAINNVIFFISFPWLLTVSMFSRLIMSATKKGEDNIINQIKILKMGSIDALTGLYNQNMYRSFLASEFPEEPVGIIFYDVNGLKKINDEKGHEYGDILLKRCAASLNVILDDKCHGFRIGGDEFLVVADDCNEDILERKLDLWRQSVKDINAENKEKYNGIECSMAVGTSFGMKNDVSSIIALADKRMYENKEICHKNQQHA